jgi:ribosomal protein S27E
MSLMYCPRCHNTQIGVTCFECGAKLIKRNGGI